MKSKTGGGRGTKLTKFGTLACLCVALSCLVALNAGATPPSIVIQPSNQVGAIFGSASFSVTAASVLPLSYQWIFNGEPVVDATNAALILGPLNCAQNGYYNVVVSNADGAVSSSKAELKVYQTIVSSFDSDAQDFLLQFTNIMVATVGSFTVYALNSDGTLVGYDVDGAYLDIPTGLSDVVAVSAGTGDVVALTGDGTIAAWGSGPTNVPGRPFNISAIAAGGYENIALQSNGTVVDFGLSAALSPYSIYNYNAVAVAAGSAQFLELLADGTVVGWAQNEGQPSQGQLPNLTNVIAIAAGTEFLALDADGTLVEWASAQGPFTNPLPNVSNVVAIAMNEASGSNFLALKADGTVVVSSPSLSFPFALSNVFAIGVSSSLGGIAMISNGAPVFTLQPANQFPTNGITTVWLHARAVGVQPMSYQWLLNGAELPNATNADLTVTYTAGPTNGLNYSVLVSNSLGSTTSQFASVNFRPYAGRYVPFTLAQALNATNLTWTTSGNAEWFAETNITEDGIAAAQSGRITNSQSSELQTTVIGPGTLTFRWMVSSEEYFDLLSFYIGSETNAAASISGEVDWEQESFDIGPGTQTLSWIYSKDPDVTVGLDAGWLAQVNFTPTLQAELGLPTIQADGTLLFSIYNTNGTALSLSNSSCVLFEASSNLVDWTPLTNALTLTNGSVQLSDPSASNSPTRFYRLLRE